MAISAILYARGEVAAAGVLAFARRLAGEAGERVAVLSAQAIRAVALGIVVTALVQSVIGGIGLAVTGVPYPVLLTAVMFVLGVAQIGPMPVLLGAVIWLYWRDNALWGTVMVVWALVTVSLDNFLRPLLIKRGADLPLLLDLRGRARGPACVRHHRAVHRSGGARGHLHPCSRPGWARRRRCPSNEPRRR